MFANLASVLAAAGASIAHVVQVTVYLIDMAGCTALGEIWRETFIPHFPARATIAVAALAEPAMRIEITAIAHRAS